MSQAPFYTKNRHFSLPLSTALCFKIGDLQISIISDIEKLEDQGLWKTACLKLIQESESNPDKKVAIRLLFICWYVLIEYGCLDVNEELDIKLFEENLRKVTEFLLDNYKNDAEVNFYLGYMVSLSAWYFSDDVDLWEKKATKMLKTSVKIEPKNPIYQMIFLGNSEGDNLKYKEYCNLAYPLVTKLYSGAGEFNLYFRQVLSRRKETK